MPQEFRDHCQERDYSHARQVSITAVVDGTTEKDRATQEDILKKASLVFSDPRDQTLAALLHACKHYGEDLFKGLSVRGSVPGIAMFSLKNLGVCVHEYYGDDECGRYVAASGSPSPQLK